MRIKFPTGIMPERCPDNIARDPFTLLSVLPNSGFCEFFEFSHRLTDRPIVYLQNTVILIESDHRYALGWTQGEIIKHPTIGDLVSNWIYPVGVHPLGQSLSRRWMQTFTQPE